MIKRKKKSTTKLGVDYKPSKFNYSTLGALGLKFTYSPLFTKKSTIGTRNEIPQIKSNQGHIFKANSAPLFFPQASNFPSQGCQ